MSPNKKAIVWTGITFLTMYVLNTQALLPVDI